MKTLHKIKIVSVMEAIFYTKFILVKCKKGQKQNTGKGTFL